LAAEQRAARREIAMTSIRLLVLALAGSIISVSGHAETLSFEADSPGAAPKGFTVARTGLGDAAHWEVREDATSPAGPRVLVQNSDDRTQGHRFPLAIYEGLRFADGAVAVRFKTLAGEIDQAAGIVWRYRNPDNYYVVRANAIEKNVVLYKVEGGKRTDLKPVGAGRFDYGKAARVQKQQWQELRVEFAGTRFRVSLDGELLFEVEDDTFAEPGQVGLWTKADSVTAFDALAITPAP
jgi:hypothetical protein